METSTQKTWSKPAIETLGTIADLTQSGGATGTDTMGGSPAGMK